MKKYSVYLVVMVLAVLGWSRFGLREGNKDYKLGVISDQGVGIVSISFDRRMVNSLELRDDTMVWLPRGLDWYEADKVKRLLEQEDKEDLAKEIFYYNLGFLTDKVVFLDDFNWNKISVLLPNLGFWEWVRFFYRQEQMIFKAEILDGDLLAKEWMLDEVMVRDFADSWLLNQDLRLTVFNTTNHEGLAGFVANRLSWAGFSVMGVASVKEEVDGCRLSYGLESDKGYGWEILNKIFDCTQEKDRALSDYEVELYIGDEFCQMINYNGYVRTL